MAVLIATLVLFPYLLYRFTTAFERATRSLERFLGVMTVVLVVWTFALVWLVQDRGWSPAAAGVVVGVAQVAGVAGRIGAGQLSDMVRSRMASQSG